MTVITEEQFRQRVVQTVGWMVDFEGGVWRPAFVTGPGRSGAIASVYVSHLLKVPFIPFGTILPDDKGGIMVVDTAINSGRTLRRALRMYEKNCPTMQWFYEEPPRVHFWYERWDDLG